MLRREGNGSYYKGGNVSYFLLNFKPLVYNYFDVPNQLTKEFSYGD